MELAIEINSLRKRYKGFLLDDVSFCVPQGTIMGLIGPNGAGKTTIIKLIMNLLRRDGGSIRLFGRDNIQEEAAVKGRIGFVYDVPPFYEDVTLDNIRAAIVPFYELWDNGRFGSLAEQFELPIKAKFKTLSHGMKMKFSLALALSHGADLILMDEPTTGLDPVFRRELLDILAGILQDERKTILFSTHITSDLERIADCITFIRGGRIVFSSTRDEIRERWGIVKGGEELLTQELQPLFRSLQRGAFGVQALTDNLPEAVRIMGGGAVVERAKLDDIMIFMEKGGNHGNVR